MKRLIIGLTFHTALTLENLVEYWYRILPLSWFIFFRISDYLFDSIFSKHI